LVAGGSEWPKIERKGGRTDCKTAAAVKQHNGNWQRGNLAAKERLVSDVARENTPR
jgi:hypothetical protein